MSKGVHVKQFKAIEGKDGIQAEGGERRFVGWASAYGIVDCYGDEVQKGAFARSIKEAKGPIPILWQHDPVQPIGVIEGFEETDFGLQITARLTAGVEKADEALNLMRDKAVTGLSIGYEEIDVGYDNTRKGPRGKPVKLLNEVRLLEVSPVTFPANDAARVIGVKANIGRVIMYVKRDGKLVLATKAAPGDLVAGDFVQWGDAASQSFGRVDEILTAPADGLPPEVVPTEAEPWAKVSTLMQGEDEKWSPTGDAIFIAVTDLVKIDPLPLKAAKEDAPPTGDGGGVAALASIFRDAAALFTRAAEICGGGALGATPPPENSEEPPPKADPTLARIQKLRESLRLPKS